MLVAISLFPKEAIFPSYLQIGPIGFSFVVTALSSLLASKAKLRYRSPREHRLPFSPCGSRSSIFHPRL